MDSTLDLKQDLSTMLDSALRAQMVPEETVEISLPGSFGEALAVTDRRVIVIREGEGVSPKCHVHAYPLGTVTGAEVTSSGMGGYIEFKLSQPPPSQDAARVYFPAYELAKFQAAAEQIDRMVSEQAAKSSVKPATAPIAAAEAAAGRCPNCGGIAGRESVFCGQCGTQLRARCATCGGSSPMGSRFCESCGSRLEEYPTDCRKCGSRVNRWQTYCPQCGSILQVACAACGASVIESWKFCPHCGRQLGSGSIDARSNFARRMREHAAAQADTGETAPASPSNAAEEHNRRGQQLFDDGDTAGAIREFLAAVNLDPQNASYHCNLAIAYDENDQDEEALAEYEKTLQLDPNDLTALLSLGYMYNETDQPERAEEVWNRILEIAPDSAEAQEVRENLRHQEEL